MASAEQLLNEAQYAFNSITAGDSSANRRHAARAKSLCKKIFSKYPGSSEAAIAHSIMMRLGEPAPSARLQQTHSADPPITVVDVSGPDVSQSSSTGYAAQGGDLTAFDWSGALAVILGTSRVVLGVLGFVAFVLFGIFGPFIWLLALGLAVLTVPVRQMLPPAKRAEIESFVVNANAWIKERRASGRGLG